MNDGNIWHWERKRHNAHLKIEFNIKVHAGPCPRTVALNAAKKLRATWVILDRQIKQDKKYFLEELSCGISKMKRNNKIVLLRGPKAIGYSKLAAESTVDQVTYGEMLPGSPEEENATISEQEATGERSPFFIADNQESSPKEAFHAGIPDEQQSNKSDWTEGYEMEEEFDNHMCSICKDRRPKIGRLRDFTYAELQAATKGFSQKNYISEGGFGSVYRGELQGLKIAVKQHKNASLQGEKEFKSEVHVPSKARHKNLVRLFGSCSEGNHRLLVYEYVCYGSLDQHLSRHNQGPPSWKKKVENS
nr:inactive protein kinase [Quercus suber]